MPSLARFLRIIDFFSRPYLELENARVRLFLSINEGLLPEEAKQKGIRTYRSITAEGEVYLPEAIKKF